MCNVSTINVDDRQITVAEPKVKYIWNIIDAAKECDFINRIILFGSSTGSSCRETSDIDLAVFGSKTRSKALTSKKFERFTIRLFSYDDYIQDYDILYFKEGSGIDSPLLKNISVGEVLYER